MRASRLVIFGIFASMLSCHDPTSVDIASSLQGEWQLVEDHPGGFFEMNLTADGSALSGTGDFAAEAGPGGSSTVQGDVANDVVTLTFTLHTYFRQDTVTSSAVFKGNFVLGELRGTMQFNDSPGAPTVFKHAGLPEEPFSASQQAHR